ncbi:MAG: DUF6797 domain-containing protein [Verrucomicrobiaceae bacterium]
MMAKRVLILLGAAQLMVQGVIREDFRENVAHIPVVDADLSNEALELKLLGPGSEGVKLSHHPEVKNDPHYLWNGQCAGPVVLAFEFEEVVDLSGEGWGCRLQTKNVGGARLHLALQVGGRWLVQEKSVEEGKDWNVQWLRLGKRKWLALDPETVTFGEQVKGPDLSAVTAVGFAAPVKPKGSKSCIRLDWFELRQGEQVGDARRGEFLEAGAPFLRSALLIKDGETVNRVRRGLLVPLGEDHWGCFDPDLLRWAAFWKAPAGEAPLSYDSMAAVSYPEGKAKAKKVPSLRGEVLFQTDEVPGVGEDDRAALVNDGQARVGPLGGRHWLGHELWGRTVVLHYEVDGTVVSELVRRNEGGSVERMLRVGGHRGPLRFRVGRFFKTCEGEGARLRDGELMLERADGPRVVVLGSGPLAGGDFPTKVPAVAFDGDVREVRNPGAEVQGVFTVRPVGIPMGERFIRPTDLAFLSDGVGLLTTLDGDVWRIEGIEEETSRWRRVASGIYEPISLEVTPNDRVFVLGRDQVTELIDVNGDSVYDEYRNASDAFQQTLQTRDYATSLEVLPDGSFLVAKGGIHSERATSDNELSGHRGTIVHLSADGREAKVVADGLRLPYVGLRGDGAIFASDQQGNFVPSTPIHVIGEGRPYLGHPPTNFQKATEVTEPLLWYPYQTSRSGAAFATSVAKGFPDLGAAFLQVSWSGRLFAIETPEWGQAFSWQLPLQLGFPSLNGTSHPTSGRLYVTGLGISGYKPTTEGLIGIASIEETSAMPVPESLEVGEGRIEVRFKRPLAADEVVTPGSPALRMFDIERTGKYGSGHFRWDGEPGEHRFQPEEILISEDRRTLTLTFPHLYRSDVTDLFLNVTAAGNVLPLHFFTRPEHLPVAGKGVLRELAALEKVEPVEAGNAARGKDYFAKYACAGCHSLDETKLVGPSLKGLAMRANEAVMKESILDPNAVITKGYAAAMPSFAGVLTEQELADLLAYLGTLK